MLKGAPTNVRKAQATSATMRMKRASEPELSLLFCFSRAASRGDAACRSRGHRPLVSGAKALVKLGWQKAGCALCAARMNQPSIQELGELFAAEPDRLARLSFEAAGIYFDWSKTHLDQRIIGDFLARANACGFDELRTALFAGGVVNKSEGRPATHVAERGNGAPEDVDLAAARRRRMRALVDAIEAGAFGDVTGILHIGIGGSVLGPALLVDALGRRSTAFKVSFLSNIDGAAFDEAVKMLDPATTLVVVASKTFTTLETMTNLEAAREWLRKAGVEDPDGRCIAVSANPEAALAEGIDETRILQFGEGVGGRYSLWSSVGITAAPSAWMGRF